LRGDLASKYARLKEILGGIDGAVVAFSGGVDSTLLLKAGVEVLGPRALAVTVKSEIHPRHEGEDAIRLAAEIGARHRVVEACALEVEHLADNPPDRCYYCKKEIFGQLLSIAREEAMEAVLDGSNVDDTGDYRPGMRAVAELGVRSPLREAGLSKEEIREISREFGLSTWNKPSLACLASRFPYGDRITPERLARVDAAEDLLRDMGVSQVRVRDHSDTARIEVAVGDFEIVVNSANRQHIVDALRRLGYLYVALDLEGYRTGSLNAPLKTEPTPDDET
jgi:uncharacterized protein